MAIQCTNFNDIDAFLEAQAIKARNKMVKALAYIGEKCVNAQRNTHSYTDRTGNLRSSVGYIVVANGKIALTSAFETVNGKVGKGDEGSRKGREMAQRLAKQYPNDFILIVVAGMEYAYYVAGRGYDVLDTAELEAGRVAASILSGFNPFDF